jgi:phage-related protein (TIGR01555 family)
MDVLKDPYGELVEDLLPQGRLVNNYEIADQVSNSLASRRGKLGGWIRIGDVYSNPDLSLGLGTTDPMGSTQFPNARGLTWNLQRIESVIRSDPYFTRALEYRSATPLKKGVDISSDGIQADRIQELNSALRSRIFPPLKKGIWEGDAFGWSALLIIVKGQTTPSALRKPLDISSVKQGDFIGLKPLTRWYQVNPLNEMFSSEDFGNGLDDPMLLGTPKYYGVAFDGKEANRIPVHSSRLMIISRNDLSFIEKKVEQYGGTSLLEQCFDDLSAYHSIKNDIRRIIHKAVIPVLKLDEMASATLQSEEGQKVLEEKLTMMGENIENNELFVIGNEDELTFEQASVTDLDKILAEYRLHLASSLDTPPSILFFEEQDTKDKDFNTFIEDRQEFQIRPVLDKLIPLVYTNLFGEEIPHYSFSFKPLENPTLMEIAEARYKNVMSIKELYTIGGYNLKSVMDSLSDIDSNPTDIFRNLDIEYYNSIDSDVTYQSQELEKAEMLNQNAESMLKAKSEGASRGGDPKDKKKPTPRVSLSKEKG